jgi:mannose-6-phosphate isomerase-like protein (cupin superfamily)
MKHIRTGKFSNRFKPLVATRQGQLATMNLRPGDASDDRPSNEHPRCEQWVFVLAGSGRATIGKTLRAMREVRLVESSLLIIERGELHQIKNTGRKTLRTINVYLPPAYDSQGQPLKATK